MSATGRIVIEKKRFDSLKITQYLNVLESRQNRLQLTRQTDKVAQFNLAPLEIGLGPEVLFLSTRLTVYPGAFYFN